MIRTQDITSVTEHRSHLKEHLRQVKDTGRPLFITTNGEADAVLLSPAAYDELAERAELAASLTMLDRSMADIKAGRTMNAKQAIEKIAAELSLPLERRPDRSGSKA